MREKLQTRSLTELREFAKAQGIKGVSGMRKAELIDILCGLAQKQETGADAVQTGKQSRAGENGRAAQGRQPSGEDGRAAQGRQSSGEDERAAQGRQPSGSRVYTGRNYTAGYDSRQGGQRPYGRYSQNQGRDGRGSGNNRYNNRYNGGNEAKTSENGGNGSYGYGAETAGGQYGAGNGGGRDGNGRNGAGSDDPSSRFRAGGDSAGDGGRYGFNGEGADGGEPQYVRSDALQGEDGGDQRFVRVEPKNDAIGLTSQDLAELDSGIEANGILEVMPDGFGFIRCENFLPGEHDVYVAPSQIRRFNLKTGDIIVGNRRVKAVTEKFAALLYIKTVNGYPISTVEKRPNFEDLTPIFPNCRLHMENPHERTSVAMRVLDLLAPIGKGQRGMIVSPPKAGKTTLLKQVAKAITENHPDMHLIILLIDERPEEVTDIREAIVGPNVEVIYSTFDEQPERHKRVSEMVIERAKRLVEHGRDVIILLDSITRLARAYNLTVAPSGRTLSGGLDPAALYMPKRFFGAARNMREGGSLTILATALVDTGSRMDDVVYEEFKGTGNMELVLDRKLSEKRIFPAIDILKSSTRRDDLLLTKEEMEAVDIIRKVTNSLKPEDAVEKILDLFYKTRTNREFVEMVKKIRFY